MRPLADDIHIVPRQSKRGRIARCLMVYDWRSSVGPDWLDMVEEIFRRVGVEPFEATATCGEDKSHGSYKRVRKRLAQFLAALSRGVASPNVTVNAGETDAEEGFFPCRAQITLNSVNPGLISALVALDDSLVSDCHELLEICGKDVFQRLGPAYGCAWDFPCAFGPDAYLVSMVAVPRGMSTVDERIRAYGDRLTRWRDRRWAGLRHTTGYLREVYPVNFVLDRHLAAPVGVHALGDLMRASGTVQPSSFADGLFMWEVASEQFYGVRAQLETSGLVLSAACEPAALSS